jgi:hypothetical protein
VRREEEQGRKSESEFENSKMERKMDIGELGYLTWSCLFSSFVEREGKEGWFCFLCWNFGWWAL